MKKTLLIILAVIAVLVLGFFAFNAYIYNEKQADPNEVVQPYQATLSGTQVCLPHKGNGPSTKECAMGIKTDAGEFYAMDFSPMSQTPPADLGDSRFTAQGVITPLEFLSSDQWQKYDIVGIFSVTSITVEGQETTSTSTATTTVSTGPTMTAAVTSLGVQALTQGLMITPVEVVSDSRCPSDVQCIWAGEIEVKTTLATFVAHGEHNMKIGGEPQVFGDYTVRLIDASPAPVSTKPIAPAEYRLTYEVVKN